jgi:vancomycin permeability regulator SanA
MARKLTDLFRPFGIALGIFIVLNLTLALQRPDLSATKIWLHVELPEPELSLFAALLAVALFVPDAAMCSQSLRWLLGGVLFGFWILAGASTVAYYEALYRGRFATDLPVPLSAVLSVILASEFVRVSWWRSREPLAPPPARVFFQTLAVAAAFLGITLAHIVTFGRTDHRRPADAAVIFGAKVYADGKPCAALVDRLETGIRLFDEGLVHHLIMTGALDPNGWSEPAVMRDYASRRGVPLSRIIVDESGFNTRASALSTGAIQRNRGFERLLAVTQYFHCARVKLIFDREGTSCYTVPTCAAGLLPGATSRLSREGFFLLREAIAFPFYLLYYR